jgi:hypothetical protein
VGPEAGPDAVKKIKNSLLYRESNSDRPSRSPVMILTELPQFYKHSINGIKRPGQYGNMSLFSAL